MNIMILPQTQDNQIAVQQRFDDFAEAAHKAAVNNVFIEYRRTITPSTKKAHLNDIMRFLEYLAEAEAIDFDKHPDHRKGCNCRYCKRWRRAAIEWVENPETGLVHDPYAWRGITYGIVKMYKEWLLNRGYAVRSINRLLSSLKVYLKFAKEAGVIPSEEAAMIATVKGVHRARAVNEDRAKNNIPTRISNKKSQHQVLTVEQVKCLVYSHDMDTAQGRRDHLLVVMLSTIGMRVSDLANFRVKDIQLGDSWQTSYYHYTPIKTANHSGRDGSDNPISCHNQMTPELFEALKAYDTLMPTRPDAKILRASHKGGKLTKNGMSRGAIYRRLKLLGERCGIENLTPHDMRHTSVTITLKKLVEAVYSGKLKGEPLFLLRDQFGWKDLTMPQHYAHSLEIPNEGLGSIFD